MDVGISKKERKTLAEKDFDVPLKVQYLMSSLSIQRETRREGASFQLKVEVPRYLSIGNVDSHSVVPLSLIHI